jgi:hypothetical protein
MAKRKQSRQPSVELDDAERAAEEQRISEIIRLRYERERAAREAFWAKQTPEDILRMRIEESRGALDPVTSAFLGMTVPLYIEEMRDWSPDRRVHTAHELGEIVAFSQGAAALADPEARGTAKRGELAKVFNAIARGLACLAYCPGGVVFAGNHWEAES